MDGPSASKWLRDNDPRFRTDTVVLTGSSSSGLRDSVGILAGRRGRVADPDLVLLPMGFRTFARLTAHRRLPDEVGTERIIDLSPLRLAEAVYEMVPWLDLLVDAWEAYLHVGGFPAAVSDYITALTSGPGLESELLRVITGDAFRRARMADVQTHVMLRRLVGGLCSPLNVARLAREVGVPQPTAQRRVDDLREAFVIWPVHRELGEMPALRSQRKYYFTDPIYTRLVTGAAPDLTALSEQQLGMALLRNLLRRYPGAYPTFDRVLYHRSGTGAEIDYVGRDFGGVAIESKYVDGGWAPECGSDPGRFTLARRGGHPERDRSRRPRALCSSHRAARLVARHLKPAAESQRSSRLTPSGSWGGGGVSIGRFQAPAGSFRCVLERDAECCETGSDAVGFLPAPGCPKVVSRLDQHFHVAGHPQGRILQALDRQIRQLHDHSPQRLPGGP